MAYHTTDSYGITEMNPPVEAMRELLEGLEEAEDEAEHPDVSLTHDSGWTLTYSAAGVLVWENYEDPDEEPVCRRSVGRDEVLTLWQQLSRGRVAALARLDWEPL